MRASHLSWNLAGLSFPLLVAALTVPQLISRLGAERFGLLALAWGLIGYAGALDLGIGRALTQMVARLRGEGNLSAIPNAVATAARITMIAGFCGGALIALAALGGAGAWITTSTIPAKQITGAIILLAVALPAQAMSATYKGLNEAFLNFKGISLLRIILGALNFGGPYLVSFFTTDLIWVVATLVLSRLAALVIYRRLAYECIENNKAGKTKGMYSSEVAKSLFSFGGWLTVSSVLSPMLTQADRFLIALTISAAAVTTYVLPYEMVVQSLILVGAITTVVFPTMSKLIYEKSDQWESYFRKWLLRVCGLMFFICISVAFLLPYILNIWIGVSVHPDSIVVGQILCIGVFANSIGAMYYSLLHAKGRADITAKIHMIELPIFIAALLFLLNTYGVEGAAWAWVGRMSFDAFALALTSRCARA